MRLWVSACQDGGKYFCDIESIELFLKARKKRLSGIRMNNANLKEIPEFLHPYCRDLILMEKTY